MNSPMATGTIVTDSRLALPMASVFVHASGLKSRPSCASRLNTGRNDTVMMSSEKKSAGPTSLEARTTTSHRSPVVSTRVCSSSPSSPGMGTPIARARSRFSSIARSRCLCMFSIMTIAPSIIAPIAIAMPPRLMMSAPRPRVRMAMKAMRIPSGSVRITTSALRTCTRKSTVTSATTRDSSSSLPFSVPIARWIRSERS